MPPIEVFYIFLIGGIVNAIFGPWAMNLHLLDKPITVARILACFGLGCAPGAGQLIAVFSAIAVMAWYLDEVVTKIGKLLLRIPGLEKVLKYELKK